MNKETLEKAAELSREIDNIKRMLSDELLYVWNGAYKQYASHGYYTTKEIDAKLREILTNELERKEKEFAEL